MFSGKQQAVHHSMDNIITDGHFLQKTNETYERYVFNTRKQKAHETVDDYISALCTLASSCNFCDCLKDSLLRDRIVLGIKHSSTRKRLLQEADLNLETCIAMCHAAEATSPSQPVKTETWTEDTTAVQAGSVSSGEKRPVKKQDFSLSWRRCDPKACPEEVEMSEVNFNTELDDSDDSALQWNTAHRSSGFPRDRTEHKPSTVYSTAQPMSDNTSGSPLSLNTSHVCYLCSAAFVLVSSLELHLASVHGEKLHMVLPGSSTPDRCDAGYYNKTDIDKGVDSHSNRKMTTNKVNDSYTGGKKRKRQHVCDVCRKSFHNSSNLNRHKLIHRGVKAFVCDVCSKSFTEAAGLTTHMRMHTGERPYTCPHCDSRFKQSSHLHGHIKSHKSKSFPSLGSLKSHLLVHSDIKSFVCDTCGKSFSNAFKLKTHKLIHIGCKPFVCEVCGKGFTEAASLTTHKRIHTGERPYQCPHCDSRFKQSSHLHGHIKSVHEGARPHVCDVCAKSFTSLGSLKSHSLVHSGIKSFVCDTCGKSFSQAGRLTIHKRVHTGERPYKCPRCDSDFKESGHLQHHIKSVHEGVKPHVCDVCGAAFPFSSHLTVHRRIHTGEKPHVCSDCGKGFARSSTLSKHRLSHSGEKPHSCPHCPSAFRDSQDLKKHVKRKHQ